MRLRANEMEQVPASVALRSDAQRRPSSDLRYEGGQTAARVGINCCSPVSRKRSVGAWSRALCQTPRSSRSRADRPFIEMRRTAADGQPHPQEAFVFGTATGERIVEHKTAWGNAVRRAGLTNLHTHDLRRESGSRLLEAGVSLHVVSVWLGHSNVSQTSTYLSINLPQLHAAKVLLEAATGQLPQTVACKQVANQPESLAATVVTGSIHRFL
jgi:integrase-like protein